MQRQNIHASGLVIYTMRQSRRFTYHRRRSELIHGGLELEVRKSVRRGFGEDVLEAADLDVPL